MIKVVIVIKPAYLICAVGNTGGVNVYKQQKSSKAAVEV